MSTEIIDGFKFQKGIDGSRTLIVESSNLEKIITYILNGKIKSITINVFQGYELPDIYFLNKLSDVLEELYLPETKFDIQVLNSLHNLKKIGFADNKKDLIDLANFPNLQSLACEYSLRLKGLESCKNLIDLTLTGYKSKNLYEIPELLNLKELSLYKTNITNLQGIEKFNNLKKIEIFSAAKLINISEIKTLSNTLEIIEIDKCKNIEDYHSLGSVQSLKKIIISESGEIQTLEFIKMLPNLKFISFWGTNVKDGDLRYCKGIDYVGFNNKKHYSHKNEDFRM